MSEAELFINKLNACYEPILTKEGTKHAIEIIENQNKEIERLQNIIKEVREYIDKEHKLLYIDKSGYTYTKIGKDILEILDKENNNE